MQDALDGGASSEDIELDELRTNLLAALACAELPPVTAKV